MLIMIFSRHTSEITYVNMVIHAVATLVLLLCSLVEGSSLYVPCGKLSCHVLTEYCDAPSSACRKCVDLCSLDQVRTDEAQSNCNDLCDGYYKVIQLQEESAKSANTSASEYWNTILRDVQQSQDVTLWIYHLVIVGLSLVLTVTILVIGVVVLRRRWCRSHLVKSAADSQSSSNDSSESYLTLSRKENGPYSPTSTATADSMDARMHLFAQPSDSHSEDSFESPGLVVQEQGHS